jgi:hypothetical protein
MYHESGVSPMLEQGVPLSQPVSSKVMYDKYIDSWNNGARDSNNDAWGIVQWDHPLKLIVALRDEGKSFEEIDTIEVQLDALWNQLEGTELGNKIQYEKAAGDHLKQQTTVLDSMVSFLTKYERPAYENQVPGSLSYNERLKKAEEIAAKMSTNTTGGSSAGCGGSGSFTDIEGVKMFYQYKDPWKNQSYGGTIEACGCGPTSFAIIVSTLGKTQLNPKQMADWFVGHNGLDSGCGSAWIWDENGGAHAAMESEFGIKIRQIPNSPEGLITALKQSGTLVVSSQSSDDGIHTSLFTSGGHIMVMRGVTANGRILVADPASEKNTTNSEGFDVNAVIGGSKGQWAITKG